MNNYALNRQRRNARLLRSIKRLHPEFKKLLKEVNNSWGYEDHIYRFYHYSYKVYSIQYYTLKIVAMLRKLARRGMALDSFFEKIIAEGTGKKFRTSHNKNWPKHTRPMLEAFFHARFFLEMIVKFGKDLDRAPTRLPSGWAALLELYNMR